MPGRCFISLYRASTPSRTGDSQLSQVFYCPPITKPTMKKHIIAVSLLTLILCSCPRHSIAKLMLGATEQAVRNDPMNKNLHMDIDYTDAENGKTLEFYDGWLKVTKCYMMNKRDRCFAMMYIIDDADTYNGMVKSISSNYVPVSDNVWKGNDGKGNITRVEAGYSSIIQKRYIKYTKSK